MSAGAWYGFHAIDQLSQTSYEGAVVYGAHGIVLESIGLFALKKHNDGKKEMSTSNELEDTDMQPPIPPLELISNEPTVIVQQIQKE